MLSAAPVFRRISAILAVLAALGLAAVAAACGGSDPTPVPTPFHITAEGLHSAEKATKPTGNLTTWAIGFDFRYGCQKPKKAGSNYDVKLETRRMTYTEGLSSAFGNREYEGPTIVCKVDENRASTITHLQVGDEIEVLGVISNDGRTDLVVKDCSMR